MVKIPSTLAVLDHGTADGIFTMEERENRVQRFYFQVVDDCDDVVESGYFKAEGMDDADEALLGRMRRHPGSTNGHLYVAPPNEEPSYAATLAMLRAERD